MRAVPNPSEKISRILIRSISRSGNPVHGMMHAASSGFLIRPASRSGMDESTFERRVLMFCSRRGRLFALSD